MGCWTCRLRKKKCDEAHPRCSICTALHITCHYAEEKPRWMDNGELQSEMLLKVRQEVKNNARYRLRGRSGSLHAGIVDGSNTQIETQTSIDFTPFLERDHMKNAPWSKEKGDSSVYAMLTATVVPETAGGNTGVRRPESNADVATGDTIAMSSSESALVACFSDYVLPLVFKAYRPCMHLGTRSWVLGMATNSSVIRKIACLQASYILAAANRSQGLDEMKTRLQQMSRSVLASAVVTTQVLTTKSAQERIQGGLVVLVSILLMQHFGLLISIHDLSNDSLNIATKVFERLIMSSTTVVPTLGFHSFRDCMELLGPAISIFPDSDIRIPNAEQAALTFAVGVLLFDDIITSTVRGKTPALRECHGRILWTSLESHLELLNIVGCSSLVLFQISAIAGLADWKRECQRSGVLYDNELARQASGIREILEKHLRQVTDASITSTSHSMHCDAGISEPNLTSAGHCIWTHGALLYLHIVVAGFQYDHVEVQDNVNNVLNILEEHKHSQSWLQSVAWPLVVAGCLASEARQEQFTCLSSKSQTPTMSGSVHTAEVVMRKVWAERISGDITDRDFTYFCGGPTGLISIF